MIPKYLAKSILCFYNSLLGTDLSRIYEIPVPRLKILLLYKEEELYRPEVIRMLNKGLSQRDISRILGIGRQKVRTISKHHYEKKNKKNLS